MNVLQMRVLKRQPAYSKALCWKRKSGAVPASGHGFVALAFERWNNWVRKDGNRAFDYCPDHSSIYMALDKNIALSVFTSELPTSQSSTRCQ